MDCELHLAVARAADDARLAAFLAHRGARAIPRVKLGAAAADPPSRDPEPCAEHAAIPPAIVQGDARARDAMRRHLPGARARRRRLIRGARGGGGVDGSAKRSHPGSVRPIHGWAMTSPDDLGACLRSGLASFPVTHFDRKGGLAVDSYAEHVAWLSGHRVAAQFAAGGAGEFHALSPREVGEVVRAAKGAAGDLPVVSGCGYGTALAVEIAGQAERAGADGLLLMPPYLVAAPQEGLAAHVRAVCRATDLGVVLYGRGEAAFAAETVARLAEDCPNVVGYKDGSGDLATVQRITGLLGDRLALIGGMPTHELHAQAYRGAGVATYSSAVLNFVPELALAFHAALGAGDRPRTTAMLEGFYHPFAALRDRVPGYAVSLVKAGVELIGRHPGRVRPPLTDPTGAERAALARLIEAAGPLAHGDARRAAG